MARHARAARSADTPAALGDAALERLAGAAVFARGAAYAHDGRCQPVHEGDAASEWWVRGSEDYRVSLQLGDGGLDGDCTCPYADDGGFCKHMVAAALVWRQRGGEAIVAPATEPDALQAFLHGRPAAELADRLLAWAARDRHLSAQLKAWQARHELAANPAGWKPALDAALRKTRDFYDPADCRAYARRGDMLLPVLRDLVQLDPAAAREACVRALQCIFRVGEDADDSGGHIGDLMHRIHAVLIEALRAAPPAGRAARRWLRTWFELQDCDPWGLWGDEAMLAAAGPDVGAHYSRQIEQDWADWLARGRRGDAGQDRDSVRWRVRSRYLADRRRNGDAAAVLAALQADLGGAHEVLELAGELEKLGRQREALQVLEAGARSFRADWRIEEALLAAYERDGCDLECLAIRRARLERQPDVAHYAAALQAALAAGLDREAYRQELHRWARGREQALRPTPMAASPRNAHAVVDVSVRLCWLLHDGRPQEALALARQTGHSAGEAALHALAGALGTDEWQAADAIYRQLMQARMGRAQSPYRDELALAGEWLRALPAAERDGRLEWLRASYRAKRNFIAGLPTLSLR